VTAQAKNPLTENSPGLTLIVMVAGVAIYVLAAAATFHFTVLVFAFLKDHVFDAITAGALLSVGIPLCLRSQTCLLYTSPSPRD